MTVLQTKPLPATILDHVVFCLEEQLYPEAVALLQNALIAGVGTTRYVPTRQVLSLLSTLAVHPNMTTRTCIQSKHQAADDALQYLYALQKYAPYASNLKSAFQFEEVPVGRLRRRSSELSLVDGDTSLSSKYAQEDSLWKGAHDFWNVVGWAFNCSVCHKRRWERWAPLLDLWITLVERDFSDAVDGDDIESCLLIKYLGRETGRSEKRRKMRAILADGSESSLQEFAEIWKNEAALPKAQKGRSGKKGKLDLEADQYADYDVDSDDSRASSTSRQSSVAASIKHTDTEDDTQMTKNDLGGSQAIQLRRRLLVLLMQLSHERPAGFLDGEELLDLYTEFLRDLPLPSFQQLALLLSTDADWQASLDQMMLRPLIANAAPVYNHNALTQEDLETHFLPFPANLTGVIQNARVSLIVENLLRLLWTTGGLQYTERLRKLVEQGVSARNSKADVSGRKKLPESEREEQKYIVALESSAQRMLFMIDMIQGR